jgi:TolA-binding protein
LVGKYGVSAIPFVVFADPLGNMIAARRGFSPKKVAELTQIFEEMPKDFSTLKEFYDAIELKKDDGFALLRIADAYRGAKMVRLSNEFYKRALKTPEIQSDIEKKERAMTALGVNSYNLKDFESANEYMEDYLKEFPNGKNKEVALAVLIISNAGRKKLKEANKYFEILKAEFAASKYIGTATNAIENAKNNKDK